MTSASRDPDERMDAEAPAASDDLSLPGGDGLGDDGPSAETSLDLSAERDVPELSPSVPPAAVRLGLDRGLTPPPSDRGRRIALGVLGGLAIVSVILVARGRSPAEPPATQLTSAVVVPTSPALAAADAEGSPAAAISLAPRVEAPAPRTPTWRVSSLKHDDDVEILEGTIGRRGVERALVNAGLARAEARKVDRALDGIRKSGRGQSDDFVVAKDRARGYVVAFEYVAGPTEIWQGKADDATRERYLTVKKLELFSETKHAAAALLVTSDLPKAVLAANLREGAADAIDDALDGHVDQTALKAGARMRVAYHEEWVEGAFSKLQLDAVEYVPVSGAPRRFYFYERDASAGNRRSVPRAGFYDVKAQQPYRGSFRSPVPLARITSRFNPKRLHPVLHVVKPHNGVDFGAQTGTPVYAAAPGTVSSVGDGGPCGNMVQITHAGGLTTAYCHLSRFASGLRGGQRVDARQLIGYVGQTGRATGPHLHFAVKRGGAFIDPLALKMDGVRALNGSDRDLFMKRRVELDAVLDGIALPSLDADTSAPADDEDEDAHGEGD